MQEQENIVYKTYDYDAFKFMEGNRTINDLHLSRVKKSLSKKQLPIPIIVTEDMEIFEGQHRFISCRDLGLPIYYIKIKDLTLNDAITINSISRKWTAEDYFNHYLTLGKENYVLLQQFIDITGLSLHNARQFLEVGTSSRGFSNTYLFQTGEFEINDYSKSLELFNNHLDYQDCPAFARANCKIAIIKVMRHPKYNHERMVKKLERLAYKVTNRASVSDYLQLFSEIYNDGVTKDNKVYFHLDL